MFLQKRQTSQRALNGLDIRKVAKYGDRDLERLMKTDGIIRNRLKLAASITNAQAALKVQKEFGSLDSFLWRFVDDKPVVQSRKKNSHDPAATPQAEAMRPRRKARGLEVLRPAGRLGVLGAAG